MPKSFPFVPFPPFSSPGPFSLMGDSQFSESGTLTGFFDYFSLFVTNLGSSAFHSFDVSFFFHESSDV